MRSPLDNLSADAIPFEEEQAMSLRNGFGLLALTNLAIFGFTLAVALRGWLPGGTMTSWVLGIASGGALVLLAIASFRSFAKAEEYTESGDLRGSWVCLGLAGISLIMVLSVGDTPSTMRITMLISLAMFLVTFGFYAQRRAALAMAPFVSVMWYLGALGAAAIPLMSAFLVAFGVERSPRRIDGLPNWETLLDLATLGYMLAFPLVSAGFFSVVWKLLSAQVSLGLWHRRDEILESAPRGASSVADLYQALNLGRRPPAG